MYGREIPETLEQVSHLAERYFGPNKIWMYSLRNSGKEGDRKHLASGKDNQQISITRNVEGLQEQETPCRNGFDTANLILVVQP